MYRPYGFKDLNLVEGLHMPSPVKGRNNEAYYFWERALFQRAQSVLKFTFPDEWQGEIKDYILYVLFKAGFGVVANNVEFGTFFQHCTLEGQGFYYQPIKAKVSNPMLSETYTIGKDCELIKLTPDYMGIWDIIDYYAYKLSLLDNAINMSLINSKFAWILAAKTRAAGNTLKKLFDKINSGEPLVIVDGRVVDDPDSKSSPFQFLDFGNVKDRYITTEQLQDFATLIRQFDTEIGIPTVPYEKKERMVESEAESKEIESVARVTIWKESLESSFNKVNEMFDLGLKVELRFEEKGDDIDEPGEDNPDRSE